MKIRNRSFITRKYLYVLLGMVIVVAGVTAYGLMRSRIEAPVATPDTAKVKKEPVKQQNEPVKTDTVPPTPKVVAPSAPASLPAPSSPYPLHTNIIATVFWAGEGADESNDFIHNRASAWMADWVSAYGGIDAPDHRCGSRPGAFIPKENPFYFALPFGDYNEYGRKQESELRVIPWYADAVSKNVPLLKNRWIEVAYGGKVAYAQWEDVGPFREDDVNYVFGTARPIEPRAGLDMSPALADYLGIKGRGVVNWRFIDAGSVPDGEWVKMITHTNPSY